MYSTENASMKHAEPTTTRWRTSSEGSALRRGSERKKSRKRTSRGALLGRGEEAIPWSSTGLGRSWLVSGDGGVAMVSTSPRV
jgi:hypothetical protein